jgi:hypothetical protein
MKSTLLIASLITATALVGWAQTSVAPDLDSVAPVVVKTVPEAGSKEVAPGEVEIKVVFSKEMMDKSWSPSTAWKDSTPQTVGEPKYEADHKTWVMKVKLEPGKTYGYWLNSQKFTNFKDVKGTPAVPYLLTFKTNDAANAGAGTFTVLGAVKSPGSYPLSGDKPLRLREAVARAGGLSNLAEPKRPVGLVHQGGDLGTSKPYTLKGEDDGPVILPGDVIIVPGRVH